MAKEYIEREAALEAVGATSWAAFRIKSIPAADVAPVVHGEWEFEYENLDEQIEYCCSVCDWIGVNANEYNYCPNCGARMDMGTDCTLEKDGDGE